MNERPVTLITGSSRGIGRYLVTHYMNKGHIVAGCSRNAAPEPPDGYEHFCLDVSDEAAVKAMISAVYRKHGRIDHVINSAGIAATNHFLITPADTVRRVYNTNVVGAFVLCREAARVMKKRNFGRIVNFSTVAVEMKLAGEAVYASSKAAVESLTQILGRELGPFGITVNTVGPTPVPTDLIAAMPAEGVQSIISRQPIPRPGTMEDIANVTDFFLQPESSFVTGQIIYLGGF